MNKPSAPVWPVAIPALLLIGLSGCTGDGDDGTGSGEEAGSGGTCLVGSTWNLDIDDSARQLGEYFTEQGLTVIETSGEGQETFAFNADGTATTTTDLSYTITIDNDGSTLTLVQTHTGSPAGEWTREGDELSFANWTADYTIENHIVVDGVEADSPIESPEESLDGQTMTFSCDGDTLTTKMAVSPFTQHWTR